MTPRTNFRTTFHIAGIPITLTTDSPEIDHSINSYFSFFPKAKDSIGHTARIALLDYPRVKHLGEMALVTFLLKAQRVLRDNGTLLLHGAALAKNDRARIFLGPCQSGKTLLSLFAAQHGYQFLSDEICAINVNTLSVSPFVRPRINLHPCVFHFFKEYQLDTYHHILPQHTMQQFLTNNKTMEFKFETLCERGISIGAGAYRINDINIFQDRHTPLLRHIPLHSYLSFLKKKREVLDESKTFYQLLQYFRLNRISRLNLRTPELRKSTYDQLQNLLELGHNEEIHDGHLSEISNN